MMEIIVVDMGDMINVIETVGITAMMVIDIAMIVTIVTGTGTDVNFLTD
jgi:hypothetical protein